MHALLTMAKKAIMNAKVEMNMSDATAYTYTLCMNSRQVAVGVL